MKRAMVFVLCMFLVVMFVACGGSSQNGSDNGQEAGASVEDINSQNDANQSDSKDINPSGDQADLAQTEKECDNFFLSWDLGDMTDVSFDYIASTRILQLPLSKCTEGIFKVKVENKCDEERMLVLPEINIEEFEISFIENNLTIAGKSTVNLNLKIDYHSGRTKSFKATIDKCEDGYVIKNPLVLEFTDEPFAQTDELVWEYKTEKDTYILKKTVIDDRAIIVEWHGYPPEEALHKLVCIDLIGGEILWSKDFKRQTWFYTMIDGEFIELGESIRIDGYSSIPSVRRTRDYATELGTVYTDVDYCYVDIDTGDIKIIDGFHTFSHPNFIIKDKMYVIKVLYNPSGNIQENVSKDTFIACLDLSTCKMIWEKRFDEGTNIYSVTIDYGKSVNMYTKGMNGFGNGVTLDDKTGEEIETIVDDRFSGLDDHLINSKVEITKTDIEVPNDDGDKCYYKKVSYLNQDDGSVVWEWDDMFFDIAPVPPWKGGYKDLSGIKAAWWVIIEGGDGWPTYIDVYDGRDSEYEYLMYMRDYKKFTSHKYNSTNFSATYLTVSCVLSLQQAKLFGITRRLAKLDTTTGIRLPDMVM